MASVTVLNNNEPGRTISLEGDRFILGRASDCDVLLDTPVASRQHACIVREGSAYYVEDLQSRNGTFLNGQRIEGRTQLKAKDRIKIADVELLFEVEAPRAPTNPKLPAELTPAPPENPGTFRGPDKAPEVRPFSAPAAAAPTQDDIEIPQPGALRPDLENAALIQRTLLLGRPSIDLRSMLRADAVSIPSLEVGGDFYDFFAYDQILDVVIGDVMGKGIQAALLGAATRLHFLRAINNLLASNPTRLPEPKDILGLVVAEVYRHFAELSTYVTLCYARFDLREHRAQIIDCGHTQTIHVANDGTRALLQGENVPLGWLRTDNYDGFTVPLDTGDVFFFYTDGLTEASKDGEEFGKERLANLVRSLHRLGPRELVDKVSGDIVAFTAPQRPKDDVTCLAVQILDPNRSRGALREKIEITSDPRQAPRAQELLRDVCQKSPDLVTFVDDLTQLQHAVGDVLHHIAVHAYDRQKDKTIRIEASLFVNRFSVRIFHRGEGFEIETEPALQAARQAVDTAQSSLTAYGEHCVYLQKWLKQ
jgi:serine phosphatase RsbU (regulator of sigma subunit)